MIYIRNPISTNFENVRNSVAAHGLGHRHLQVVLLFTGLLLAYALRVNLSIGIVAMVDNASNPDFVVNICI